MSKGRLYKASIDLDSKKQGDLPRSRRGRCKRSANEAQFDQAVGRLGSAVDHFKTPNHTRRNKWQV
jgi:hypothetical protein